MILPNPPYELSRDYVKRRQLQIALFSLMGAAVFSVCIWVSASEAVQIAAETRTWNAGEPALSATVQGRETTSKFIFRNYDLEVRFVGKDGSSHQGRVEFEAVFGSVDSTSTPAVRYLPAEPTRFALSWGQQVAAYRWAAVGVFGIFGVALGAVFLALPRSALSELRLARECSIGACEVELAVVGTKRDAKTVRYTVEGQSPWGAAIRETFVAQPVLGGPLFADELRTSVVALVSPRHPTRALVIRDTFFPYEFSASERTQIRDALARRIRRS